MVIDQFKTTNEIKWQVLEGQQYQSKKNELANCRTVMGWISQEHD
jgi:hypothetical protein